MEEDRSVSIQESNYASGSELVTTGSRYREINHENFIQIRHFRLPLHGHAFSCFGYNHIRPCCAAEDKFVPCGIIHKYQSTEPYDGRNCQIVLLPMQNEKVGIQETRSTE